jgi:hypothetical protein
MRNEIEGHKKSLSVLRGFYEDGAPGTIRTCDRLVRSQVLYPAELRARITKRSGIIPMLLICVNKSHNE